MESNVDYIKTVRTVSYIKVIRIVLYDFADVWQNLSIVFCCLSRQNFVEGLLLASVSPPLLVSLKSCEHYPDFRLGFLFPMKFRSLFGM